MRYLLLVFLSIVYIHLDAKSLYNRDLDEIFSRLDDAVSRHDEYREQKEERIAKMRERMSGRTSLEGQYYANKLLYDEFYVYNADSAMLYVDRNLEIASTLKRKDWEYVWRINKSFLLSAVGLLKQAEEELEGLPLNELSNETLTDYYGQMMYLWSHYGLFTGSDNSEIQRSYLDKEIM